MSNQKNRTFLSFLLIFMGIAFLLNNFGVFGNIGDLMVAVVFGIVSLIGWGFYLKNRKHWWLLFPTAVFGGIAGTMVIENVGFLPDYLGGGLFLLALASAFWVVFVVESQHWWAAIPAGVLSTLAFVAMVDGATHSDITANIFFLGLGLTFTIVWLNRRTSNTTWAKWPAMILLGFSLFVAVAENMHQLWPIILILVGGWLIIKNFTNRKKLKT